MSSRSMQWYRKMTARHVLQKRRNILKLIALYRGKRLLWDRSCARFADQNAKKAAWRDIGCQFPCSVDELKQKMYSLLSAYERERNKEMCPYCKRKDPREIYRSSWYAYNSFSFLRNVQLKPGRSTSNLWDSDNNSDTENEIYRNAVFIKEEPGAFEREEDAEFEGDDSEIAMDDPIGLRSANVTESANDSVRYGTHFLAQAELSSPPKVPVRRVTVIKRKRPSLDEAEVTRENVTSPPPIPDEYSTFVDLVRAKLEKFDNADRSIIMHRINNAIFDAEMNKYGRRDTLRSEPESSVHISVAVDPVSIRTEHSWLKPVLCIPKLEF